MGNEHIRMNRFFLSRTLVLSATLLSAVAVGACDGDPSDGDSDHPGRTRDAGAQDGDVQYGESPDAGDLNSEQDAQPPDDADAQTPDSDAQTPDSDAQLWEDPLLLGETDFVSADGYQGQEAADVVDAGAEGAAGSGGAAGSDSFAGVDDEASARTVEEGDIYRVLGDAKILNLNAYRGLQIIDFASVTQPEITGRYPVSGSPVELYVVGDRAFVLLNEWQGYYGAREDVVVESRQGGLVLSVDISDRTQPRLIDQAYVEGYIQTSRLTQGEDSAALYVAATYYGEFADEAGGSVWQSRTVVKSFDVSDGTIEERTQLDLGGYVSDIQATTEALLVARYDWIRFDDSSSVTIVDISNPDGTMIEGAEVLAQGYVQNKFNMNLYNGVLRIVSGSRWSSSETNHLQTFEASDFSALTELDHCTFGDGQDLYATLFLENRAFFVTYRRQDPFHAFWVGDDGACEERSEFIVSGWNDFFRPVLSDQRLIGIGMNDETSTTMAVSLYDITDLSNPSPLLDREEVGFGATWSEARWDDRAFSVLEDAVDADAAGGETGLVLLPFTGLNGQTNAYVSAVQIFTFSETTLTRRGVMEHGSGASSPVRRSFLADPQTTANLSEVELSLFDHTAPDAPEELGRLELAPNYTQVLVYGNYAVRLKNDSAYYYYGGRGSRVARRNAHAEVVSLNENPDLAEPVAGIEVPSTAYLVKAGDLLVSVDTRLVDASSWPYDYETTIDVYDMSDPLSPEHNGSIVTDQIRPYYDYAYGYYEDFDMPIADCLACYYGPSGSVQPNFRVIDNAVVFFSMEEQRRLLGNERVCNETPAYGGCVERSGEDNACTSYYRGSITCRSLNGREQCTGEIVLCEANDNRAPDCEPVDPGSLSTHTYCYEREKHRRWNAYALNVLDLSDAGPSMGKTIEMPRPQEGVALVPGDHGVYYSYKLREEVDEDPRAYVRYFFTEIDLTAPAAPEIGEPINVPGEVLWVDRQQVFTQDLIWGSSVAETTINRLEVLDGLAHRRAVYRFRDRQVGKVELDGTDRILVSHRGPWHAYRTSAEGEMTELTILSADSLDPLGAVEVDSWATLRGAEQGRALFEVPGGLLIMRVTDPKTPYPQAYFPARGWPQQILFEGNDILFAAGRYGIYRFNASTFNLLSPTLLEP